MRKLGDMGRLAMDILRVKLVLPRVEADRLSTGPHRAARAARRRAAGRPSRSPEARARLRRAIAMVDARHPAGPNCLRRSLLEMSLDAGAARERLLAGFIAGGGEGSGHAWLESHVVAERYDTVIPI
jgi:hypothetical protein